MAKLTDLPKHLRNTASGFKWIDSMPAEEARHRAAHIHQLEQRCPATGELQTLTFAHTKRLADALPVAEYLRQLRHLHEMADQLPGTIDSARYDFLRAAGQLKAGNMFIPGLVRSCEMFLEGREHFFEGADISGVCGAAEEGK
jgi:hypothetical protein